MKKKKILYAGLFMLAAFVVWTFAVALVDVEPIGPQGSSVGFASLNGFFHNLTGVNMHLYNVTDWLSVVPLGFVGGFAVLGVLQLLKRKNLLKVDFSILALGAFYVVVITAFIFFEKVVINCRPVLIDGLLEASYPSSTTMLVMTVIPTAMMQFNERIKNKSIRLLLNSVLAVFTAFMVIGRLVSGVHWLTDIIGGALLSAGLVMVYRFAKETVN